MDDLEGIKLSESQRSTAWCLLYVDSKIKKKDKI